LAYFSFFHVQIYGHINYKLIFTTTLKSNHDSGNEVALVCFCTIFKSLVIIFGHASFSFLLAANPDNTAGQEGSTSNVSEVTSPELTDGGDTSQSDAAVDELGESIKSEAGESLKDIMDKNKDKKDVRHKMFSKNRGRLYQRHLA
jgi:hypothetical protein